MEKAMVRSFRDLEVWQRSMELTMTVYRLTQEFPREEIYGLSVQLRRAAVSISSNIAEGQGRINSREFRQFLGVARGSLFELQTQLEIARSLKLCAPPRIDAAERLSERVAMMLAKLLVAIKNWRAASEQPLTTNHESQ